MPLDSQRISIGSMDCSALSRFLTVNVAPFSAGTIQAVPRNGASLGSWACSCKRSVGPGAPQAFPTALSFSSSVLTIPATNAMDLSGTDTLVLTNDTAGSSGIIDFYGMFKA